MTWGAAAGTVFHSGGGLPGNPSPQATDASPPSTCRWKVGKRHAGGEPTVPHAAHRAHRLRCEALAETAPPSRIPEDEHQGERMRMRLLRTPAHAAAATAAALWQRGARPRAGPEQANVLDSILPHAGFLPLVCAALLPFQTIPKDALPTSPSVKAVLFGLTTGPHVFQSPS